MNTNSTYHANGKLLLSGEYFVLYGAKALAMPLKLGQQLKAEEGFHLENLQWKAYYQGDVWFECQLNTSDFEVISASDQEKATTLSRIFKTIGLLNPAFQPKPGTGLETQLEAHPDWGFGSSSTLISLLSQWAKVDPFMLNELIFNGSGFDIACATANGPIIYIKNHPVQPAALDYPFADQLLLVYSGKKKKTLPDVNAFLRENKIPETLMNEMSALTDEFALCTDQPTFHRLIREHEWLVGSLIGQLPVKATYFNDFEGEVKSLGAWGGDYYLASSSLPFIESTKYFEKKGLNVIFRWDELIKT